MKKVRISVLRYYLLFFGIFQGYAIIQEEKKRDELLIV